MVRGDDALADTVAAPGDSGGAITGPGASRSRGDRVAHFVIEDVLGSGGMGTVYRAHDTRLDRRVALKFLGGTGSSGNDSPNGNARVWREARAAAAFNHPNAVGVYEIGEAEGGLYIAMEIVDGVPLRKVVGDSGIGERQKLSYLVDVARALGAAHRVGLVHRDVKPENVMVRRDGVIKVLDFGIARRVQSDEPTSSVAPTVTPVEPTLTAEGALIGTPSYMAPEQILAGTSVDGRADQFAWGVTACEVLTGSLPWGRDVPAAMSRALRGEEPNVPVKGALGAILRRTLRREPADRFATMEALVDALEPLLAAPRSSRRWFALALLPLFAFAFAVAVRTRSTPISSVPAAAAAFDAGMQAFRDGSSTRAARSMKEAAKLDSNLAAAYVRDALWEVLQRPLAAGSLDPEPGRALFKSAEVHRASALPYDRALIEAVEPRFRQQVDIDEAGRRLKALVDRHPKLAEPLYWLAMGRAEMGDVAGANAFIDRAMSVEPTMTPALLALRAWVERKSPSAAIAALDRCIALSPEATDCLGARARLRGFMGQCDGMEADAHAWVAADRDSSYAYFALAEALEARGAAVDGVRLALHSGEELAAADERTGIVEHNRFSLLMVQGDFASALKQAERLEETLPSGAAIAWRFLAVMEIADAALESDDRAAAGRAARRFLDRADAWTPKSAGDVAMPLAVLRLAFHTGAIESGELDRERARWMQKLQPMLTGQSESARRGAWLFAHAAMVSNAEEARAALAALPQFAPLSAPDDTTPGAARMIGRVHLLAGDRDAAVPYLRRAAGGCFILNSVAQSFGARVDLADALVSSGARDEARTLYQSVLARWGNAKPRSATADHVRAALAALGP